MDNKELFGETYENAMTEELPEKPEEAVALGETSFTPETAAPPVEEETVTSEQVQEQVHLEAKKGNNGIAVTIVTVLFILVIGLCVYIAVSVSNMIPKSGQEDKEYESQTGDPWEEILGDDYIGDEKQETTEDEVAEPDMDFAGGMHDYPNYSKEDFTGRYYQDVVDCIDESVSYEVKREFQDVLDAKNNVSIYTSYIQLDGNIPGLDEINRLLKEEATYFVNNYEENKTDIHAMLEETGTGVQAELKSYVTYNTESIISVVVREDISLGYMYRDVALRSININLDTGTVLENTSILKLEDGFGQEFRERSNAQNGISESGIEAFSNDEIESMLNDEEALIIFYTPMGMEIGYNYKGESILGWITVTMQDYEKYVPLL